MAYVFEHFFFETGDSRRRYVFGEVGFILGQAGTFLVCGCFLWGGLIVGQAGIFLVCGRFLWVGFIFGQAGVVLVCGSFLWVGTIIGQVWTIGYMSYYAVLQFMVTGAAHSTWGRHGSTRSRGCKAC